MNPQPRESNRLISGITSPSIPLNPIPQSHPQLFNEQPDIASLSYLPSSPVDHTDFPLQTPFPLLIDFSQAQPQQAFPENSQVTPPREAGRQPLDLCLPVPLSPRSPTLLSALEQNSSCGLSFPLTPISSRSSPTFILTTHLIISASKTSGHSLGTHMPGKHVG